MTEPELENPEHQESLRKWIPYLWLAPLSLVILLALIAYFAR